MDVSKNRGGPPNWMVKILENPIKMDDLGGTPPIFFKENMVQSPWVHAAQQKWALELRVKKKPVNLDRWGDNAVLLMGFHMDPFRGGP